MDKSLHERISETVGDGTLWVNMARQLVAYEDLLREAAEALRNARNATLEEAAKLCGEVIGGRGDGHDCAEEIRALKT